MNKKVFTCDFDETLAETNAQQNGLLWTYSGMDPIYRVISFVKDKIAEGYDMYIITFRPESESAEVKSFLINYDIPCKGIYCTGGGVKTKIMEKLGAEFHIDDNVEVLVLAKLAGIDGILVDHGQDQKNVTAKLFKKI
jgi:FMN phosphatase YigB (HAD superfamily)